MEKFFEQVLDYLGKWVANDDCKHWINVYAKNYEKQHPNFDLFLKASLAPIDLPEEIYIYDAEQ